MAKRIIVSIDGGGIRGIIPLIILKEIQKRLTFNFFNLNAVWWGTSTGALISGAITIQKAGLFSEAVQNVLDMYEFRSASAVQPHGVSDPTRALNQLIDTNFGTLDFSVFPELNIVVSKKETLAPVVFNAANNSKIAEAIRASCAFLGLFPAVEIENELFVDGFFKAKNPTELAVLHALKQANEEVIVLSLGTGIMREKDRVEESVQLVDEKMKTLAENKKIHYFRFNPTLVEAVDSMQNASAKNILHLRKDAHCFLESNEDLLKRFIGLVSK